MAVFILLLTALAAVISTRILLAGSLSLEKDLVREALEGGRHFLTAEERRMASLLEDWANWDDTYRFMADTNQTFIDVNLVDNTFRYLNLNVLAFFDVHKQLVFIKNYDLDSRTETQTPPLLVNALTASTLLTPSPDKNHSAAGLLPVGNDVWLLASAPVRNSLSQGPARGTLVMGRRLNALSDWCASRHWHGLFTLRPAPDRLSPAPLDIDARSLGTIKGRALVQDLNGRPSLLLETSLARRILAHGLTGEFFLTGWILLSGAAIGLFAFWLVDRWVLQNLSNSVETLKQGVTAVTARANLKLRIKTMLWEGELKDLATCLNDMLTALDHAQEAAESQRRELIQAQKMTALGTLVAGVAHEVNNPNTVIGLNLTALQRRLDKAFAPEATAGDRQALKEELTALIEETREATRRIAAIAASLKAFARPSGEKMNERIDLNALVGKACDLLKHNVAKSKCHLILSLATPPPMTLGNEQQLTQVLINLIENSCQASVKPDSPIEISTHNESDGTTRLRVRDEGLGIAPEHLDRIFEPFFTTRRDRGGTGLGLSISLEIIQAHDGRILVDSTPGAGSAFTLVLPAHREKENA